jgi:hypothetical protein
MEGSLPPGQTPYNHVKRHTTPFRRIYSFESDLKTQYGWQSEGEGAVSAPQFPSASTISKSHIA